MMTKQHYIVKRVTEGFLVDGLDWLDMRLLADEPEPPYVYELQTSTHNFVVMHCNTALTAAQMAAILAVCERRTTERPPYTERIPA